MSKCFQYTKTYLLIVAMCVSTCAINGCVDSLDYLANDSRLPKWFTLPPGLTRADVEVVRADMGPTRRGCLINEVLYEKKYKKLAEVNGEHILWGNEGIDIVDGMPEITASKSQIDEHGNLLPYYYVVDDPALKIRLLDDNKKLLIEKGVDYPALRRKLLGEDSGPISDH